MTCLRLTKNNFIYLILFNFTVPLVCAESAKTLARYVLYVAQEKGHKALPIITSFIKNHKTAIAITSASMLGISLCLSKIKNKRLYIKGGGVLLRQKLSSSIDKIGKMLGSSGLSNVASFIKCKKPYLDNLAHAAICNDCPTVLKITCKSGTNINDIDGVNALHIFPLTSPKLLQVILEMGADTNVLDYKSRTLLHRITKLETYACQINHSNCANLVRLLIQYGARVDIVDPQGKTPLTTLLLQFNPDLEAVKLLKAAGSVYNNSPFLKDKTILEDAIHELNISRIKACILAGAKCDNFIGADGISLLNRMNINKFHHHSNEYLLDIIKLLLECGVPINDNRKWSPTFLDVVAEATHRSPSIYIHHKLTLLAMELIKMGAKSHILPLCEMSTRDDFLNLVGELSKTKRYFEEFKGIFPPRSSDSDHLYASLVAKGDWFMLFMLFGEDPLRKFDIPTQQKTIE